MSTVYKNCQSCGMPMSSDERGGGSEADGTKSTMYCSHCYENGAFTLPHITMDEMRERVIGKMKEFHFPRFIGKLFTRNLHQLERWKGSSPQ